MVRKDVQGEVGSGDSHYFSVTVKHIVNLSYLTSVFWCGKAPMYLPLVIGEENEAW